MSEVRGIPVYYDFASSLCFVAHRALGELAGAIGELGLRLDWCGLDLAALRGLRRGAELRPSDRERITVVAADLGVPLAIPGRWLDSRNALAATVLAEREGLGESFRERVWSACYERGEAPEHPEALVALARDLGWRLDADALPAAFAEVERTTETARAAEVTGVPCFMLGSWPFGGIQGRDTMLRIFSRFAERVREGRIHP